MKDIDKGTIIGKLNNIETTKAIFPGSFDPFTNGHLEICKTCSELFDETFVLIAKNPSKVRYCNVEKMVEAINETLNNCNIKNIVAMEYNGLVAEFAKKYNINYMVRGLRNAIDYNYEENIAQINKYIYPDLKYIYLRSENNIISSSVVKEFIANGKDYSSFVPEAVLKIIKTL